MLPIRYILKGLGRRKVRTAMTVLGIAFAIALYAALSAVGDAMVHAYQATGTPESVVITQAGALGVDVSNVPRSALTFARTLDGVAERDGRPLVSPELQLTCRMVLGGKERPVPLRGVTDIARHVHREVELLSGSWPGGDQVTVGRALASRLEIEPGDRLEFERGSWQVAGLHGSGGRVYDQEVWVGLEALAAQTNRTDYASLTLLARSPEEAEAIVEEVTGTRRFPLLAQTAPVFYAKAGAMSRIMAEIGRFVAIIVALGAIFGGMNTMYSSVSGRRREIGMLRAIGYRGRAVLLAFVGESVVICLAGGLVGLALAAAVSLVPLDLPYMPVDHVGIGLPQVVGGLVLALVVGVAGGGLPALRAARLPVLDTLR